MLAITDLSFERYFEPVFKPLSFALGKGELLLVTGANGSGKTTLLQLLAGLLSATEGQILLQQPALYAGHKVAIKDDLSVLENIRFMLQFMGRRESVSSSEKDLAEAVGLTPVAQQHGRTLSAGQRKRCAMARLLFCDEQLWLLDEPYSNLDQDGAGLLNGILQAHLRNGGACVMTTHGSLRPQGIDFKTIELQSARNLVAAT